jgi:hypothetical protein
MTCVKCGSPCELLLNLICCGSPRCQNFDKKFYTKWLAGCGRTYNAPPDKGWVFLGRYHSNKSTCDKIAGRVYDLYCHGPEVFALHSNDTNEIYMGDTHGAPLGFYQHWWAGPDSVDENAREALLEAAARKSV